MRAGITQGEGEPVCVASDGERNFEQHAFGNFATRELVAGKSSIPKAEQHERVGRLAIEAEFAHERKLAIGRLLRTAMLVEGRDKIGRNRVSFASFNIAA